MGIRADQLLREVIKPTLEYLQVGSAGAEALLLGTAAHESLMGTYLVQERGPALGIYQMEPRTHEDLWNNWMIQPHRRGLAARIRRLVRAEEIRPNPRWMVNDLKYATALARAHYLRVPAPLPRAGDIEGLAAYWKKHYNTKEGAGTEAQFLRHYTQYVEPYVRFLT